jgi:hypothetical protein
VHAGVVVRTGIDGEVKLVVRGWQMGSEFRIGGVFRTGSEFRVGGEGVWQINGEVKLVVHDELVVLQNR